MSAGGSKVRKRISRTWWTELCAFLVAGVLAATVLCLGASALLIGLPHGWHSATTWSYVEHRFLWLLGLLSPASLVAYAVVRVRRAPVRHRPEPGARTPRRYRGQHR